MARVPPGGVSLSAGLDLQRTGPCHEDLDKQVQPVRLPPELRHRPGRGGHQNRTALTLFSFTVRGHGGLEHSLLSVLTSDQQPAGRRLAMTADVTLVDAFVGSGNLMDGHVTRGVRPDEGVVFIERGWEVGGGALCFTAQSDVISRHHGEERTLQDHQCI